MQTKERVMYMGFGCLLTLAGYILASMNNDSIAQSGAQDVTFGTITCRRLEVVDDEGNKSTLPSQEVSVAAALLKTWSDDRWEKWVDEQAETRKHRKIAVGAYNRFRDSDLNDPKVVSELKGYYVASYMPPLSKGEKLSSKEVEAVRGRVNAATYSMIEQLQTFQRQDK